MSLTALEKQRRDRAIDDARYAARRHAVNAWVAPASRPGHYDIIPRDSAPYDRPVIAGWTPAGEPIPIVPGLRVTRKTFAVYHRATYESGPIGQLKAQSRAEAHAIARRDHPGADVMIAAAGPNAAAEIRRQIGREAKVRQDAEAKQERRSRRDRRDRERDEKIARAPQWGPTRADEYPAVDLNARIAEARPTWKTEIDDHQAVTPPADDPYPIRPYKNNPCECCGTIGESGGCPPRCRACTGCAPGIGKHAPACPGNADHQAVTPEQPPAGAFPLGWMTGGEYAAADLGLTEAQADAVIMGGFDAHNGKAKIKGLIYIAGKPYAVSGACYRGNTTEYHGLIPAVPFADWPGPSSLTVKVNPVDGYKGLIATHRGKRYVLGPNEWRIQANYPRPKPPPEARHTETRNAQAAAYRAERAEGIRDGFPVTAAADGGGARIHGTGGPQPQGPIPVARWTAARTSKARQLRQLRALAAIEEAPPIVWHVYRPTADGRLWAGATRLSHSGDRKPIVPFTSVHWIGNGRAIAWETNRADAYPHETRLKAENHTMAQGYDSQEIRVIRSDREPSDIDRPPLCNPAAFDAEVARRRAAEQPAPAPTATPEEPAKPYGFDMTATYADGSEKRIARVAATEKEARRKARTIKSVVSVRDLAPLSSVQYARTYGTRALRCKPIA